MNFIGRLLGAGPSDIERRSIGWDDVWGGLRTRSSSGREVTEQNALTLSAVYACVRILSDGISVLPTVTTRGLGPDAEIVARPPAWLDEPHPALRRMDVNVQILVSLLLRGNAYVLTIRDATGLVLELWPVDPDLLNVEEDTSRPVRFPRYSIGGVVLHPMDLLHIRGMTLPGRFLGLSPIEYARETIGLGLAAQEFGAAFFGNGAQPGGVIESDGTMSDTGVKLLRRTWNEMHQGAGNSNKLAILTEGAKYKPISIAPEPAQFLQTRQFGVADVARFYGVAPHLIGDASGSTSWGSGLAEQSTNTVTFSFLPWAKRLEEAWTWLARSERPTVTGQRKLYVSIDLDDLKRGDFKSRIETYRTAIDAGIYTVDEVRRWEGLPPAPEKAAAPSPPEITAPPAPSLPPAPAPVDQEAQP